MKSVKPEKMNEFLNVGLTPSLNEKINAFCDKFEVNRSQAARYILQGYFDGDFEIPEVTPIPKNETDFENFEVAS
jgi:hypothetical protein